MDLTGLVAILCTFGFVPAIIYLPTARRIELSVPRRSAR